jgi:hypothetical protein
MNRPLPRAVTASVLAAIVCFALTEVARTDASPSTQPTTQIQTGEVDLTFTQRSPLSTPSEIARRLKLKPASLGADYDLSKQPYKAYIPTNYDPATPHGLFVYLGYKDTVSSPPLWRPILEKYHLIFISPVCHTGDHYAPSVPLSQTFGLALDAVYNCKKQYNIDDHRIYLMSWNNDSARMSFASSDVFTGFIDTLELGYIRRLYASNNSYYETAYMPPPEDLMSLAKTHPFFMIDDGTPNNVAVTKLVVAAMQRDDFNQIMRASLSLGDDVHFPNMKAEWFEQQALPFLDKAAAKIEITKSDSSSPTTNPAASPSAAPAVNPAQHLLEMAQLYIRNGQTDLAQKKLQQIIDTYPNDPAAQKAKQLLGQMNQ